MLSKLTDERNTVVQQTQQLRQELVCFKISYFLLIYCPCISALFGLFSFIFLDVLYVLLILVPVIKQFLWTYSVRLFVSMAVIMGAD
jgi:hypothetical protein